MKELLDFFNRFLLLSYLIRLHGLSLEIYALKSIIKVADHNLQFWF
jgi:hypothetical protein